MERLSKKIFFNFLFILEDQLYCSFRNYDQAQRFICILCITIVLLVHKNEMVKIHTFLS